MYEQMESEERIHEDNNEANNNWSKNLIKDLKYNLIIKVFLVY
jgi:hypothetical protein